MATRARPSRRWFRRPMQPCTPPRSPGEIALRPGDRAPSEASSEPGDRAPYSTAGMERSPVVQVLARKGSPLIAQLSLALRGFVQLRWTERVPAAERIHTGDIFVVDLAELSPGLTPDDMAPVLEHGQLWLVPGGAAGHPSWLGLASRSGARGGPCHAEALARGVPPLLDAVHGAPRPATARRLGHL